MSDMHFDSASDVCRLKFFLLTYKWLRGLVSEYQAAVSQLCSADSYTGVSCN